MKKNLKSNNDDDKISILEILSAMPHLSEFWIKDVRELENESNSADVREAIDGALESVTDSLHQEQLEARVAEAMRVAMKKI